MIPIVVILGPTASGKSSLGIRLAKKWNGEIVSTDSRQVYKGLDIGTAKVTKKEQRQVPHHLLDVSSPGKMMHIAKYKRLADGTICDIWKRKKIPFLVGGSALYINAVIYNYTIPAIGVTKKRKELECKSIKQLLTLLKQKDLITYKRIDHANKRRLVRALEVCYATGKKFSDFQTRGEKKYEVLLLGISSPREVLYHHIGMRIDERMKKGMIAEVKKLIASGVSKKWLKSLGLEYRFITEYLQGSQTKNAYTEMVQRLKYASHDFARRQLTWFKKNSAIHWIETHKQAENLCKSFIKQHTPTRLRAGVKKER